MGFSRGQSFRAADSLRMTECSAWLACGWKPRPRMRGMLPRHRTACGRRGRLVFDQVSVQY